MKSLRTFRTNIGFHSSSVNTSFHVVANWPRVLLIELVNLSNTGWTFFLINQNSLHWRIRTFYKESVLHSLSPVLPVRIELILARFVGTWATFLIDSMTYFAAYRNRTYGEHFHLSPRVVMSGGLSNSCVTTPTPPFVWMLPYSYYTPTSPQHCL